MTDRQMSNPYASPEPTHDPPEAQAEVKVPAIALMIVASLFILEGLVLLAWNLFLILSGLVDSLAANSIGPFSNLTSAMFNCGCGIGLMIPFSYVFYGAVQMKRLKNYAKAKGAAIVSVIPFLGPCSILCIPFGIWALVVLARPHVKEAFQ